MFLLKHYDTTLIKFEIISDPLDGQKCHIVDADPEQHHLFPIGMEVTDQGVMSWLRSRFIPKNRTYVDSVLSKMGLSYNDTCGILKISMGMSLNDCYWVVEEDFNGSYSEYNLYEHDFLKALSLIAYTGYGSTRAKGFTSSPEFTTGGMLRKGWRWRSGKIVLYKGGTTGAANAGNEPFSEFYAAQIARQMGIEAIDYGLSMWKKSLCSTCELFCDIDHSYVPIFRFVKDYSLRNVSNFLRELGADYYDRFVDMLIFDALICNEDRHFGNFGLMVDNHTNQPYAFAPIFDNGLSLFNYGMPDDFMKLTDYAKTRTSSYNVAFDTIAKEFITKRQKDQLRKLIGFRFERHRSYNLPAYRLGAIEDYLQQRIGMLLSIPEK